LPYSSGAYQTQKKYLCNMNLSKPMTIEDLQRQLQETKAENSQLKQLFQNQQLQSLNIAPSTPISAAVDISRAQHGFVPSAQFASGAKSSSLSRSKSTISYPTQMAQAMVNAIIQVRINAN
jgi:hypothetical protein